MMQNRMVLLLKKLPAFVADKAYEDMAALFLTLMAMEPGFVRGEWRC